MTITATYSPEDNKIRLYASTRLDAETYARVKEAGFKWAPKQELFVAPKWTPAREDLAIELAGDIEAEEMTLAERAAIKAERLEALALKRHSQAEALTARADELSQAFYMGQPILIGHHSERKARKTQERMQSAMTAANKAASAANYWLYRATGVESFANMKNGDRTRANRIKTLLAELRDLQRGINDAHKAIQLWDAFQTPERIMWAIENTNGDLLGMPWGTYSKREEIGDLVAFRARCIANLQALIDGPNRKRWIEHILNRLAFERSLLGPVPRFGGELTPVILQAFAREHGAEKPKATATDPGFFQLESPVPLPLHIGHGLDYLELSADEWRDVMQACGYIVQDAKPRRVSSKPAPATLINPTPEQAEQLQRIWNKRKEMSLKPYQKADPATVQGYTQATWSARAKGTYSAYVTEEIAADGSIIRGGWRGGVWTMSGEPVARIRVTRSSSYSMTRPDHVAIITDKPGKPLPLDLDAIERQVDAEAAERAKAREMEQAA